MKPRTPLPLLAIFGIPLAIAFVTAAGLMTALLDDGLVDAVSWAALSVPVLAAVWAWRKRER
ncbi:membrane protein implicated in regulation of membrane protease activity [Azospirillum lipoferum]|uniref:DUF4175 domain-containing protein n=1 Tax=Azospirillum lipoferum TaxID=193 RepID=A0A5A9GMB0_AZOLI|nr:MULTISPECIES: hypothetical protein [Azospirillum]KAA0595576.1 hypothetical protein FZ942_14290 [Azospirillum lipoferum]MCP1611577.1 membrane protein implicated in regulation of membrane protease activity [Azospirillum lipoferum]MDW5537377.1 hypothetical protein [Azospirillum sp. NL1]